VLLGSIALGLTAWAVEDTRPFAETSWWPPIFIGLGLLYGGLMPALINLDESHMGPGRFLAHALLFHLLPIGAVLWYAMGTLQSTAYGYLVTWCMATLALATLLTLGGAAWRLWRRKPP
jgi:hypothetical protein